MAKSTNWNTWTENQQDYTDSITKLSRYIEDTKGEAKTNERDVNLELAGSMKSDLKEVSKLVKSKAMDEFYALDSKELDRLNLTKRQKEVAQLLQTLSYSQVAKRLGINRGAVYDIYTKVLDKFKDYQENKGLHQLSEQQKEIYKLHTQGLSRKQIALELDTTPGAVKTQLNRIRKKLI